MAKVLIAEAMNPIAEKILEEAGHEVVKMPDREEETFRTYIRDCDAVLVRILPMGRELMESAPKLKVICKHGVGIDNFDLQAAKDLGIAVTTTPDANGQSVAEHTVALMLALSKNLLKIATGYRTVGWNIKDSCEGIELFRKTIAVIGCGKIGSRVARMALNGFDMRVLVYDPYINEVPEGCEQVASLDAALIPADFVTVHCCLDDRSRGLIGPHEFGVMKNSAIFLNCARGPIVDEQALVRALQSGEIGGAGLDVTDEEPLPKDHPLLNMENVICTPHYAPTTHEAAVNVARIAAENAVSFLRDGTALGRVV